MIYIFTPTYNRKHTIINLYNSLCKQSNKNFIWLIVDDGSTDETNCLVEKFIIENKIKIIYKFKENGGKHSAYNLALDIMPKNAYHICVDSDDYLGENTVDYLYEDLENFDNRKDFIGVVYPRTMLKNGNTQDFKITFFPNGIEKVNIPDIMYKFDMNFETGILINNLYLKDFRFPIFDGENFISEFLMYSHLSNYGKFYTKYREDIYFCSYLEDGITKNLFSNWEKNLESTLYDFKRRYEYISKNLSGKQRLKGLIRVKLNTQALKLKYFGFKNVLAEEFGIWLILIPFSFIFKNIRFKGNKKYDT